MNSPRLQVHLLTLADTVALILACRLTPDALREILLNFTKELKEILPPDSARSVEAAEAKAVIRAVAYRRDD